MACAPRLQFLAEWERDECGWVDLGKLLRCNRRAMRESLRWSALLWSAIQMLGDSPMAIDDCPSPRPVIIFVCNSSRLRRQSSGDVFLLL